MNLYKFLKDIIIVFHEFCIILMALPTPYYQSLDNTELSMG